jgi:ribonuclease HII
VIANRERAAGIRGPVAGAAGGLPRGEALLAFERRFWESGFQRVAGVDEAGRGPLAGPVVAAAVVMERGAAEAAARRQLDGLTDSKQLRPGVREMYFRRLQELPHVAIGVGLADPAEIDALNILRATHAAMARALASLPQLPDYALVDGRPVSGLPCPAMAIVRGDGQSLLIAAASVVAKVIRDRHMQELDRLYPPYGFAQHKGYGTAGHMQALLEYGPCPVHRLTFRPVRDAAAIHARAQRADAAAGAGEERGE